LRRVLAGPPSRRRAALTLVEGMDMRSEIRAFLTSRRARITPEEAGLAASGRRRVPGLRREEVAVLAGVSAPYYTRLERGDMHGVSDSVLDAVARALELDDAERAHLFDLARAAEPTVTRRRIRRAKQPIRPSVQHIIDAITGAAAFVRNDRLDILAANTLGYALYCEMFAGQRRPANTARFIFLDSRAGEFYPDWNKAANDSVAVLRASVGRDLHDRCLSDLVGELSTKSDEFRTRWAQHHVRQHITGMKHFRHPVVGDLSLTYDRLDLVPDPALTTLTYTAEPGSRDEETLRLLGSWAVTQDEPTAAQTANDT
jgi:transcriptional regulator with XRE-family HTH domain